MFVGGEEGRLVGVGEGWGSDWVVVMFVVGWDVVWFSGWRFGGDVEK